jgi:hypothetical protein
MWKVSLPMTSSSPTPTLAGRLAPLPNVTTLASWAIVALPVEYSVPVSVPIDRYRAMSLTE